MLQKIKTSIRTRIVDGTICKIAKPINNYFQIQSCSIFFSWLHAATAAGLKCTTLLFSRLRKNRISGEISFMVVENRKLYYWI